MGTIIIVLITANVSKPPSGLLHFNQPTRPTSIVSSLLQTIAHTIRIAAEAEQKLTN